jgi:hypothetical protein
MHDRYDLTLAEAHRQLSNLCHTISHQDDDLFVSRWNSVSTMSDDATLDPQLRRVLQSSRILAWLGPAIASRSTLEHQHDVKSQLRHCTSRRGVQQGVTVESVALPR